MKFTSEQHASRKLVVEITPMIDVVFLLIIFFMVTAQIARATRAEVDLPLEQGEQEEQSEEAGLVINISADGVLIVNDEQVPLVDLEQIVTREIARMADNDPTNLKLLIRADRNADTAILNETLNMLESMDVGAARLATEVPR